MTKSKTKKPTKVKKRVERTMSPSLISDWHNSKKVIRDMCSHGKPSMTIERQLLQEIYVSIPRGSHRGFCFICNDFKIEFKESGKNKDYYCSGCKKYSSLTENTFLSLSRDKLQSLELYALIANCSELPRLADIVSLTGSARKTVKKILEISSFAARVGFLHRPATKGDFNKAITTAGLKGLEKNRKRHDDFYALFALLEIFNEEELAPKERFLALMKLIFYGSYSHSRWSNSIEADLCRLEVINDSLKKAGSKRRFPTYETKHQAAMDMAGPFN